MEIEEDDEFGPLYFDVLKPSSLYCDTHKFSDQNHLNGDTHSSDAHEYFINQERVEEQVLESNMASDLKIIYGSWLLEGEDTDIVDDLVFDFESKQNEQEVDTGFFVVEKMSYNNLDVIGDLIDEQDNSPKIDSLELGKEIPGLFDSKSFESFENGENGVHMRDFESNSNRENDQGGDEDSESEDGLNVILNYDVSDENISETDEEYATRKDVGISNHDQKLDTKLSGMEERKGKEIGNDLEAGVAYPDHLSHDMSKGVRQGFMHEIAPTDLKGNPKQAHPFRRGDYGHGIKLNYLLSSHKSVFDIDIDSFGNKPWRHAGIDVSKFFNFDFDEENWKDYCKQMKQLRLQISAKSKISGWGGGQLQKKKVPEQPIRRGTRVKVGGDEIENHHQILHDSGAIIEIVFMMSIDHMNIEDRKADFSFHGRTQSTSVHRSISGDGILPFPLDGSCERTPHEERGSQMLSNDYGQERRQINLESMVTKRKDYQSMHLDKHKERRMTAEGSQEERLKHDPRKRLHYNKMNHLIKGNGQGSNCNYDMHFAETKRMKVWGSSHCEYMSTNSHEFLGKPQSRRKNNEYYPTIWNRLVDHQFVNLREKSWSQEPATGRQKQEPATGRQKLCQENKYDNHRETENNLSHLRTKTKIVHRNYHHKTNGGYKFTKASVSKEDMNIQPITDPADNQEQEISNNQNSFNEPRDNVISVSHKFETEGSHIELDEDSIKFAGSPEARKYIMDESDNELITEINDFVREINALVDGENCVGENRITAEMMRVVEDDRKTKERNDRLIGHSFELNNSKHKNKGGLRINASFEQ